MKPTLILVVAAALGMVADLALISVPARAQATVGTAIPQPSYRTYVVSDAAAFAHLDLPMPANSLLLRNGLPQIPGVDYSLAADLSTFKMALKSLSAGDHITVVSFPGLVAGGSGALDCSTLPGVCDLTTAVVPFKQSANLWTGANDFSSSPFLRLPLGPGVPATGCALPADQGKVYVRNDAALPGSSLFICDLSQAAGISWDVVASASAAVSSPAEAAVPILSAAGVPLAGHIVAGSGNFSGYVATLTLSGTAAFTSSASYHCFVSDQSGSGSAVGVTNKSGTSVALTDNAGAGTGPYAYLCIGN